MIIIKKINFKDQNLWINILFLFQEPKTTKKESTFLSGFFLNCVESDPLNMKISIPQTGFVPGQTINITIETNNDSDQDVSSFNVAFRRVNYVIQKYDMQNQIISYCRKSFITFMKEVTNK